MHPLNEQGLYDIYSIWHVPFWQTKAFYYTVGSCIGIVLLMLTWGLIRWYRAKKIVPKTAWQLALDELHALQQKQYLSAEESKACYFAMTNIIKTYFIARFDYPLQGKTDDEVVQYLLSTEHHALAPALKEIMHGCQYIKFAHQTALHDTVMQHLAQCNTLITKTIPTQTISNASPARQ